MKISTHHNSQPRGKRDLRRRGVRTRACRVETHLDALSAQNRESRRVWTRTPRRLPTAGARRICEPRPKSRIIATMALSAVARAGYTYKSSPYSSHTLLVDTLPPEGRGKRVL